jgi:hypothetical protein
LSLIFANRSALIESKEGFTYILKEAEEKITSLVLKFAEANEKINAERLLLSIVKKLKLNPQDSTDAEYVDVDELLKILVQAFEASRDNQ